MENIKMPLRMLILEDRPEDAELMLYELRKAGIQLEAVRVDTESDFQVQLAANPDIILADYSLPQYGARQALQYLQERGLDIPFIIVTGALSDEQAVACLQEGATDYVRKDRLTRLGHVVTYALDQQRLRKEKQQAQEELRESEARYHTLFELANDAIFLHPVNPDSTLGQFIEVNHVACERLGYSREELLRLSPADIDAMELAGRRPAIISEMQDHGHITFEMVHLAKDQRCIPVEISSRLFTLGGQAMVLSIARDLTERKEMQKRLLASEKMASIGQFAAGASHELNNPLACVIGFSEAALASLADKRLSRVKLKTALEKISHNAQRCKGIVASLLAYGRAFSLEPEPVPVHEALEEALALAERQTSLANIHVIKTFAGDLPVIHVNREALLRVFVNIILNACQAMDGKGILTLTTQKQNSWVEIVSQDTGKGISAEHLSKIFDPFFSTREVGEGTGMGLSVCAGIIHACHGEIKAESRGTGQGATFTVRLPIESNAECGLRNKGNYSPRITDTDGTDKTSDCHSRESGNPENSKLDSHFHGNDRNQ